MLTGRSRVYRRKRRAACQLDRLEFASDRRNWPDCVRDVAALPPYPRSINHTLDPTDTKSKDEVLDDITLYWLTNLDTS